MPKTVRIGSYSVDLPAGQLYQRGSRVHLREQSFQVLAALLERPGEVVTREEFRRRLWPDDVFVDFENSLNTAVARLREALGDSADHPKYIETLPRRGYRFIGPLTGESPANVAAGGRRPKLLVLPFADWSNGDGREFLGDAVTDELITAMATLAPDKLAVIARTTAVHYRSTRKDVATIGRELEVDYIVEGAIRSRPSDLAINVQLIRVSDQTHLWARRFDVAEAEAFDMSRRIAGSIGQELGIRADEEMSPPAPPARTANLEAYTLYKRGRFHFAQGTPDQMALASQLFEKALAIDPAFALAYDALAELHWYLGFFGIAPAQAVTSRGLFFALRALDFDDTLAETHALVGLFRKEFDFNWADVKREMDRALALAPSSPIVKMRYAMGWLLPEGRLKEAIAEIESVLETDPLSVFMRAWLGCFLWLDRQYDRAIGQARLTIEIEPANFMGHWQLGLYLRECRAFEDSIASLERALALSGGSLLVKGWLGLTLGQAGRPDEARRQLKELEAAAAADAYVPPTSFAWTYLGLGELDEAFHWMDRAVTACDHMIIPIQSYPFLDGLREDGRFLALLDRLGLVPGGGTRCASAIV